MEIKPLASSSLGNCYYISDGTTKLLIECGIRLREIQFCGIRMNQLDGCLITHEHKDHSKSIVDLIRYCVPVYASYGTLNACKVRKNLYVNYVEAGKMFSINSLDIIPFETQHDAVEPLGYYIKSRITGETLLFATDTYFIHNRFESLNYIMVECNYKLSIVQERLISGKIPKVLAARLMHSHFEFDNVKTFLKSNDLSKCKEIYLLHLSRAHSDEVEFKKEIEELTGIPVIVCKE